MPFPEMTDEQAKRFCGGRARHNKARRAQADKRRAELLRVWLDRPGWSQGDLARHFGVCDSTISGDIAFILSTQWVTCPMCGSPLDYLGRAIGREIVGRIDSLIKRALRTREPDADRLHEMEILTESDTPPPDPFDGYPMGSE